MSFSNGAQEGVVALVFFVPGALEVWEEPREGGVHGGFFVAAANASQFFEFILGYGLAAVDQSFGDGGGKFPQDFAFHGLEGGGEFGCPHEGFLAFPGLHCCTLLH